MRHAITFDIGGTYIKYALINEDGRIVDESLVVSGSAKHVMPDRLNENNGLQTFPLTEKLNRIIRQALQYASSRHLDVAGIGIGVPSVVDNGVVLFANNLPELTDKKLDDALQTSGLPVRIDNDANLMGLGEIKYGAAKNASDVVFLTVGTGIGGALFLNGQLYGGYRNRGTELGHFIVRIDGKRCTCGACGCLEAHASVTALIESYRLECWKSNLSLPAEIDGKYIVARYLQQEEAAVCAMEEHFNYMAVGVAGLINIFAPQRFVIGGGITESGDFYIRNIRRRVTDYVMKETSGFTIIEKASLGNRAGCLGAAALVFEL